MKVPLVDVVLVLVAVQRIAELLLAARNTRTLRARGAHEVGAAHYPLFIAVHVAWLLTMFACISPVAPVNWYLLAFYVLLQPFRLWVMRTLGTRWTTRIIVLPGAPLVGTGPYRFLRHPNYAIVALEIATLPSAFGAYWIAALFTLLNAAALWWRIRVEEAALSAQATSAS